MLWLDVSYLKQVSYKLRNFKEKQIGKLFNFSCPICGDSSKKATKARFYMFEHKNHLVGKCHNCQASISFGKLLKELDYNLYERYVYDRYKNGAKHQDTLKPGFEESLFKPKAKESTLEGLTPLTKLGDSHPAMKYIKSRNIPKDRYGDIYFVEKFFAWANKHTDKFKSYKVDHSRIVLPWMSVQGKMVAFDARSIDKVEPRYYHVVIDDTAPLFFGLNKIDFDKPIHVVEGSFDSMFVENCLAVGTAALYRYQSLDDVTYIPDKDVRNKEVMKVVKKMINMGLKVCMLPPDFPGKDLNEFIKTGRTVDELKTVIESNTYQGLMALNHFSFWKKCDLT